MTDDRTTNKLPSRDPQSTPQAVGGEEEALGAARLTVWNIFNQHHECFAQGVVLNDLIDDLATVVPPAPSSAKVIEGV